ncbi:hypothetical protein GTP46_10070 [Duganella sp. FT135W]|uniref:DUF2931 family protein n=1 Tax=Duganella flavida TaxID=2692175 RepID=A0A6L8K6X7_9BURK|nr:hypothetical protein [Duganella flavida]MYM22990.1 hypothetical protein [Duganella flavida]
MKIKNLLSSRLVLLVLAGLLGACTTTPAKVDHRFSFDFNPRIEVLDYQYGSHGDHAESWELATGHISQGTGINGRIFVPEYLYVKWKVLPNGPVHEDRVDLKSRLPADITNQHVYFFIEGAQLNVYLISPESANPPFHATSEEIRSWLTSGHADDYVHGKYGNKKITKIYPIN